MKFDLISADPPWQFDDKLGGDVDRGAEAVYQGTMSIHELLKLPVQDMVADTAAMLLWVPAAMILEEGRRLLRRWGFEHKQVWVWVKTKEGVVEAVSPDDLGFYLGRYARNACEFALLGTRGSATRLVTDRTIRNVFFAPNLRHSQKPECVQDALEQMFGKANHKLELFARRDREGWACLGNECPSTMGRDIRECLDDLLCGTSPFVGEP